VAIIVGIIGVVGSVASIVALLITSTTKRQRFIHGAWSISLAVFVVVAAWSQQKLSRIERVERAATALIEDRRFNYTPEGFVQASLAFLEKNRDLYPDAYARAQEICRVNKCTSLDSSSNQITAAYALEGLLRGIATISKDS